MWVYALFTVSVCVCVVLIANGDCQVGYRETVMTA